MIISDTPIKVDVIYNMRTEKEIREKYDIVHKRTWVSPTVLDVFEWVLKKQTDEDMSFVFGDGYD